MSIPHDLPRQDPLGKVGVLLVLERTFIETDEAPVGKKKSIRTRKVQAQLENTLMSTRERPISVRRDRDFEGNGNVNADRRKCGKEKELRLFLSRNSYGLALIKARVNALKAGKFSSVAPAKLSKSKPPIKRLTALHLHSRKMPVNCTA